MCRTPLRLVVAAAIIVCLCFAARGARGETVVWNLTPESKLAVTIEIYIDGVFTTTLAPQGPGADVAPYSGTLSTELTASTIQFTGGHMIAGNTGDWQPLNNGDPGSAPANYGHIWDLGQFGTAVTAIRNSTGHLESGALALAGPPNALSFAFAADEVDLFYDWFAIASGTGQLGAIVGTPTGHGPATTPMMGGVGTIQKDPGLWTLTVPVDVRVDSITFPDTPLGDIAVVYRYVGTVAGTIVPVPEPSSAVLGALGCGLLGLAARRQARRARNGSLVEPNDSLPF